MSKEFKRTDWMRHLKLGKKRGKITWRRAKGKHSKIRRKRTGYPRKPEVGFKSPVKSAGLINGKIPVLVNNIKELSALTSANIAILARVGAKKKLELIKKAEEMKIQLQNVGRKK
jgi:large subunit ribosomal protein L32e